MFVGVCRISLRLHGTGSLKAKRGVVRRVVERSRAKFNASVAEVGDNDSLGRAVVGAAVIGNSAAHVDSMIGTIVRFVERLQVAPVLSVETEVVPLGGDIGSGVLQGFPADAWPPGEEEGVDDDGDEGW